MGSGLLLSTGQPSESTRRYLENLVISQPRASAPLVPRLTVTAPVFPRLRARDLEGLEVELPAAFDGHLNLVAIAFRREHQGLVDSWVPWFEQQATVHPGLRFYEVPTIGRVWAPVRNFIDGAMASAIREPVILQRTLTVYGDVSRVTAPLGIDDRSTIAVVLVDPSGHVLWLGRGGFSEPLAHDLETVLADDDR